MRDLYVLAVDEETPLAECRRTAESNAAIPSPAAPDGTPKLAKVSVFVMPAEA